MKKKIEGKLAYYKGQLTNSIDSFLKSNKREDRERMLKNKAKIEAYTDILECLKEVK